MDAFQKIQQLKRHTKFLAVLKVATTGSTPIGDIQHSGGIDFTALAQATAVQYMLELSSRVQSISRCERKIRVGVQRFFAQSYTFNCKPPVAARTAATAAGVKGRRNSSGSQRCKKLQRTAAS